MKYVTLFTKNNLKLFDVDYDVCNVTELGRCC
jgi:hypothetical protein